MASRKLAVTTVVPSHGGDGPVILGPDDDVPEWAVEFIGDHCWADGGEAPDEADKPRRGRKPTVKSDDE